MDPISEIQHAISEATTVVEELRCLVCEKAKEWNKNREEKWSEQLERELSELCDRLQLAEHEESSLFEDLKIQEGIEQSYEDERANLDFLPEDE